MAKSVRRPELEGHQDRVLSFWEGQGVHPKVAQELARHSDINLTLSRYSHTTRDAEKAAVEAMVGLE